MKTIKVYERHRLDHSPNIRAQCLTYLLEHSSSTAAEFPAAYITQEVIQDLQQVHPASENSLELGEVRLPHLFLSRKLSTGSIISIFSYAEYPCVIVFISEHTFFEQAFF